VTDRDALDADRRVIGVDVARALALFGMVIAHTIDSTPTGPGDVNTWFQLVAGRSAALFAVLAGVSLVLSSSRNGVLRPGARSALATRAVLVAVLGLLLGPLGEIAGIAVILTYYGALFLFALPVLGWSARALGLLAAAWGCLSPAVSTLVRPLMPEASLVIPQPASLLEPLGLLSELLVTGYYPCLTWATYLFAGMAVGRLDLRRAAVSTRLAWGGLVLSAAALVVSRMVLGSSTLARQLLASDDIVGDPTTLEELGTEVTLGFFGTTPSGSWWWLAVWAPHSGSIVDLAHTTGCAILVIGICVLLTRRVTGAGRKAVTIAFGAGRMTLTLYAVHVVLAAAAETTLVPSGVVFNIIVLALLGALFAATAVRGPLEAAVRHLQDLTPAGRL